MLCDIERLNTFSGMNPSTDLCVFKDKISEQKSVKQPPD